jgi:reticulon-4-interacting protein 1, mitochondrial
VALGERGELKVEVQEVIEGAFDEEVQGWRKAMEAMEGMRVRGKMVLSVP